MIIVSGAFQIPAENVDAAKDAMRAMMAETVKEDGCVVYQFTQSIEDPSKFRVYEEWETEAHLKAHFDVAHMATFRAALGELGPITRKVKMIEAGATKDL